MILGSVAKTIEPCFAVEYQVSRPLYQSSAKPVASFASRIHLLITDVVMPAMNGRELADIIAKARPNTRVLFMSGHTEDVVLKQGVQKGTPFLQKPFTPAGLAQTVRETLDSSLRPFNRA